MRSRQSIGAALTALAAAGLLAACTSAPPVPHRTPVVSHTPTGRGIAAPSHIPNVPRLRSDVATTSCKAADGGWRAGGRVTNNTGDEHDYTITVLFTDDHATVIGFGDTHVHLAAGGRAEWSVTAELAAAAPTLCVLSGVA